MGGRVEADLRASLVVLLVAIPFCSGVATASGAGLQAGFVTAMVAGLVVGPLGGARLQISGPAVGLAALVLPVIQSHGLMGMAAAVFLAGLLQMAAGLAGLGALVRRVPVPVVAGAVCAAGLAQTLAQLVVLTGHAAAPHGWLNLCRLPSALAEANLPSAVIAALTLAVALSWHRVSLSWARAVPGPMAGVIVASLVDGLLPGHATGLHVAMVLPALDGARLFAMLRDPGLVASGCLIALVASVESLVAAEATAWAASATVALSPNRELVSQGLGNVLCGLLGGLPLAGAIPRSAANMRAGAQSALSNILHAVWLAGLLGLAPWLLGGVSPASLAALLVLGGWRLVWERTALTASVSGLARLAPFLATLGAAMSLNLASGIAAGCATSLVLAGIAAVVDRGRLALAGGQAPAGDALVQDGQAAI